jgi:hypothetical protein
MINNSELKNPWTIQDEGDHYPVMKEWWTIENFFKTHKNNRKWNLMTSIAYEMETPSCFFQYSLFDLISKKCILHKEINENIEKLLTKKNKVDLRYGKTTINGIYPNYKIHIEDGKQDFIIDMMYRAKSLPHWVAQDVTNGKLPIGFNFYKYGFLPHCDTYGTLNLNNTSYEINGKGYLEHAWGNWTYQNPLQKLSDIKTSFSTYGNLIKWWLSHHKPHIPHSITFTTENNPFGYDWIWGISDNDWSLFYGNSLFWISEGPVCGSLCITPDGKKYWEFSNINFRYNKLIYIKEYDLFYPCEIELNGKLNDKSIHLKFWKTTDPYEYIDPFKKSRLYKAFVLCGQPGRMEGIFSDNNKTVSISGDCKIVPLRHPSIFGHNSVKIDFIFPPKKIGLNTEINTHYFKKRIKIKLNFTPKPTFKFNITKLNNNSL